MLGLHLISCIIFTSIFEASLLPLKYNVIINDISSNKGDFKTFYSSSNQHDADRNIDGLAKKELKFEMMESSESNNYYSNHHHQQQQQQQQQQNDDDEYADYASDVAGMSADTFESAKLKPSIDSDSKQFHKSNEMPILDLKLNISQLQQPQVSINVDMNNNNSSKFSKLLFASPSATVTSNGPSGPFKAIICHDCENSGGVNVGHSVSFSAIKSWNVGSSNVAQKSSFNESLVKQNHQDFNVSGAVEHTSQKYFDATVINTSRNNKDSNAQINQNVPVIENQGSAFKVESVTVNDSGQQSPSKDWNYSLLSVRNENIKVNDPKLLSSISSSLPSPVNTEEVSNAQKKPIFNDLLKVPYDILNQPLTEAPPSPSSVLTQLSTSSEEGAAIKQTQIRINHQQKFNDTITNYQHFQHFIQKNPNAAVNSAIANTASHYKSTPMPELNYEVDESVSLMTNGRAHGVQSTTPKANMNSHVVISEEKNENHHSIATQQQQQQTPHSPLHVTNHDQDAKFGVVFEGRDFRKYKVEEKTADGFIVGEYGYLSNTDGSPIFGVRYTADSNINPQLIYDALLKFLKL